MLTGQVENLLWKACSSQWLFAFFLLMCKCSWYIQDKYGRTQSFPLFTLTGVLWWKDGLNFNVVQWITVPLWGKSTFHASLVKKALPLQVTKTSSCRLLRAVLSHPPFHWVSCSIWKAAVYGRRETDFSILPRGPLVDPVQALEAHLLPMHCSVTSLVNHATGHVCCFWTLLCVSVTMSRSRSQSGSCLAHPTSRSGYFLPTKPHHSSTLQPWGPWRFSALCTSY